MVFNTSISVVLIVGQHKFWIGKCAADIVCNATAVSDHTGNPIVIKRQMKRDTIGDVWSVLPCAPFLIVNLRAKGNTITGPLTAYGVVSASGRSVRLFAC